MSVSSAMSAPVSPRSAAAALPTREATWRGTTGGEAPVHFELIMESGVWKIKRQGIDNDFEVFSVQVTKGTQAPHDYLQEIVRQCQGEGKSIQKAVMDIAVSTVTLFQEVHAKASGEAATIRQTGTITTEFTGSMGKPNFKAHRIVATFDGAAPTEIKDDQLTTISSKVDTLFQNLSALLALASPSLPLPPVSRRGSLLAEEGDEESVSRLAASITDPHAAGARAVSSSPRRRRSSASSERSVEEVHAERAQDRALAQRRARYAQYLQGTFFTREGEPPNITPEMGRALGDIPISVFTQWFGDNEYAGVENEAAFCIHKLRFPVGALWVIHEALQDPVFWRNFQLAQINALKEALGTHNQAIAFLQSCTEILSLDPRGTVLALKQKIDSSAYLPLLKQAWNSQNFIVKLRDELGILAGLYLQEASDLAEKEPD